VLITINILMYSLGR